MLLAITLHEAAHGFVAWLLGDDTALRLGRVSANPLRHVDPVGTVVLPGVLLLTGSPMMFGWAKPVPVDFGRLRRPRRDMVLVALAGPGTNLALAVISAALIHVAVMLPGDMQEFAGDNLINSMRINLVLAVFNMLPLPPLDGGRVAVGLLPDALARPLAQLERFGMMILLGALMLLPMIGLDVFPWLIGRPVYHLTTLVLMVAGLT
ncbi:MAG: site-2 protease family protein [Alphaproteobacteria bacterium]|nr:site-2 protease family protein [Alphaproteobacteria bacterium]